MGFRPTYETEQDRAREREVMAALEARSGLKARQMPLRYPVDIAVLNADGKIRSFVEVKRRNISYGQYDHLHLSVEKVVYMKLLTEATSIPVHLCAYLKDGMYLTQITDEFNAPIEIGGRVDRGDPDDVEPVYCIPWGVFRPL